MAGGVTLRTLFVVLSFCFGLLVLLLALGGAADAIRDSGVPLEGAEMTALTRSIHSTQLVRGLIGIGLTLLLAGPIASAAAALFAARRPQSEAAGARPEPVWLREAQDVHDAHARLAEENAERLALLRRQRGDLDRLLEAVSEGILQLDSTGRIVRANRAAQRLLTLPEDAAGRQIGAVVRSAELRALLQAATVEEGLPPREISFEDRTLVVTARALAPTAASGAPEPPGLAVAIADLTAVRRLESVRRDFVANASHELKTPLTSIRGYAETLLDESVPAETRRQFLTTISSNADRLQHIVDDLLDLSRLESGHWEPALAHVIPAEALEEAWTDVADRARLRGVEFGVVAETEAAVLADQSAMRQIFVNLFQNALRYTPAGGRIDGRVTDWIMQGRDAGARDRRVRYLAIQVRDTGSGIPSDALPRIFERFYRVDPARSRAEGGTGLGLSIVKHLVESMGGAVEAESQLGRGTTIRIILPVASGRGAGEEPAA